MEFELLNTKEQFENLKKGDFIIVEWSNFFIKHHQNTEKIMSYSIYENREKQKDIICRLKGNHFFNYEMYLGNISSALEVYKVILGGESK